MKVLFENYILAATLSALNASSNYPVDNLKSPFLKMRAQSTAATDTFTATLVSDKSINCIYYGWTNATGIVILLKDAGGSTLKTITIAAPESEDADAEHFIAVPAVKTIDIQLTGAAVGVYLGGFAAGLEETFPDPNAEWEEPKTDNSVGDSSLDGQYSQNYIKPLRAYSWLFSEVTRARASELSDAYVSIGINFPIWVDPFEEDHSFIPPIYCVLTDPIVPAKNGRRYSFTLAIAEAR